MLHDHRDDPDDERATTRGQVQLVDSLLTFFVLVALVVVSPILVGFVGSLSGVVDGFTQLVFQLFVPAMFVGLILSLGISARRGS
jgi:hypothetical protein